jgi:SHAQKYF class myb-like DNA-binding protein
MSDHLVLLYNAAMALEKTCVAARAGRPTGSFRYFSATPTSVMGSVPLGRPPKKRTDRSATPVPVEAQTIKTPVARRPVVSPVCPKPVFPKPVFPKPVCPKPVCPKPVCPKPVCPKPVCPKQGRWSPGEHASFLKELARYGPAWREISKNIPTRTTVQIRTHAQKYFLKLKRGGHSVGV